MSNMQGVVHGGGAIPVKTKRVFLATGKAREGYAVCYNHDVTDVTAENEAKISASAAMWCDARKLMVEEPTVLNNLQFAGIVDQSSAGVTGPAWIQIHTPGSICKVYTQSTVTTFNTTRGQGANLSFTIAVGSAGAYTSTALGRNGTYQYAGLFGEGSVTFLAEGAASVPGDTYLKMGKIEQGLPSGGVEVLTSTATVSCLATATEIPLIAHGRVIMSCATITAAAATISYPPAVGSHFDGQTLILGGPAAAATAVLVISMGSVMCAYVSADSLGQPTRASTSAVMSISTQYIRAQWDGVSYYQVTAAQCTTLLT